MAGRAHRSGETRVWLHRGGARYDYQSGCNEPRDLRPKLLRVYGGDHNPWKPRDDIKDLIREFGRIQLKRNKRLFEVAGDIDFADHVIRRERVLGAHQGHQSRPADRISDRGGVASL